MKQLAMRFPLFFGLVFIVCAITACKTTSETESPLGCTVVAVGGDAHYRDNRNNKIYAVKVGDYVPPEFTIEVAKGTGNFLDLAVGRHIINRYRRWLTEPAEYFRINENSIFTFGKVILRKEEEHRVHDISLVLRQGSILFTANSRWIAPHRPGAALPVAKSYWEIRGSNVVLRADDGTIWFNAVGLTLVLSGTATIESIDKKTLQISRLQRYNPSTGEISPIELPGVIDISDGLYPDMFAPYTPPGPRFPVPQRPF